jgi:hypothetical protein
MQMLLKDLRGCSPATYQQVLRGAIALSVGAWPLAVLVLRHGSLTNRSIVQAISSPSLSEQKKPTNSSVRTRPGSKVDYSSSGFLFFPLGERQGESSGRSQRYSRREESRGKGLGLLARSLHIGRYLPAAVFPLWTRLSLWPHCVRRGEQEEQRAQGEGLAFSRLVLSHWLAVLCALFLFFSFFSSFFLPW